MKGVEGQIKRWGVTHRLTPCLHIDFDNTTRFKRGVTGFPLFCALLGNNRGVTLYFTHALSQTIRFG